MGQREEDDIITVSRHCASYGPEDLGHPESWSLLNRGHMSVIRGRGSGVQKTQGPSLGVSPTPEWVGVGLASKKPPREREQETHPDMMKVFSSWPARPSRGKNYYSINHVYFERMLRWTSKSSQVLYETDLKSKNLSVFLKLLGRELRIRVEGI